MVRKGVGMAWSIRPEDQGGDQDQSQGDQGAGQGLAGAAAVRRAAPVMLVEVGQVAYK